MKTLLRFNLLLFVLILSACNGKKDQAPAAATSTEEESYDESVLPAFHINQIADSLRSAGQYKEAMASYQMAMDTALALADSFGYYDARLDLATVHDRLGELDKAISIAEPIVDAYIRSGDSLRIGRAYSTLAAFYERAHQNEKGLITAVKGFEILKNNPSLVHRCAAYNQMAFTYSDLGDWVNALPLLDSSLMFLRESGLTDLLPGVLLNVGDCHRHLEHWPEAQHFIGESVRVADSLGQIHIKAKALERLAQIAESRHDPATALDLYRKSKVIMDSLFTAEKAKNIQQLEVAYQAKEKEQEILRLKAEKDAQVAQNQLFIALGIWALAFFAVIFWGWQRKKRTYQKEMEQKKADLKRIAQILLEKNTRISELENELYKGAPAEVSLKAETTPKQDEKEVDTPEEIFNIRILTDNDWEVFKTFFERTHPGFIHRLRNKFPNLSSAEERLLLLIKLNFNRQEIASTLGISPESVKKGRQRLRKRLGLEKEDVLEEWIGRIV